MAVLLLPLPAAFIAIIAWVMYRKDGLAKAFAAVIILGIGYWYVLPGTVFLLGFEVNSDDAYLLEAEESIYEAILLIHASLLALLVLPALAKLKNIDGEASTIPRTLKLNFGRLDVLLLITVASSIGLFVTRFASYGTDFVINLLLGLASSREVMSFENFSRSAAESLMALWDIVNIFIAVFFAATLTWQRHTLSVRFVAACFIAVLSFLSTGSRSVLLLILCAIVIASICRPPFVKAIGVDSISRARTRRLINIFLIGGLIVIAGIGIITRFEPNSDTYSDLSDSVLFNTLLVNNDMFRELVYVLDRDWEYRYDGINFLLTPVAFTMPTFLGFSKSIPSHLIDFNLDRAGIDLIDGTGNVFPGLLADMYMYFSVFSPVVLLAFSGILYAAFLAATIFVRKSPINSGLLVALLCYYFISFRNVQGSFGILVITAVILQIFLAGTPWSETTIDKKMEPRKYAL